MAALGATLKYNTGNGVNVLYAGLQLAWYGRLGLAGDMVDGDREGCPYCINIRIPGGGCVWFPTAPVLYAV